VIGGFTEGPAENYFAEESMEPVAFCCSSVCYLLNRQLIGRSQFSRECKGKEMARECLGEAILLSKDSVFEFDWV
jgi:hypothetical protein